MSDDDTERTAGQDAKTEPRRPRFLSWDTVGPAYHGDIEALEKRLAGGIDVNTIDQATGLSALHVAVGTNNLALTRKLVEEHKAAFFADAFGRWPSLIAAECQVSEELSAYIVDAEARFLGLPTD
jgi:hypothetical protein